MKQVAQEFLWLKALHHNMKTFKQGRRVDCFSINMTLLTELKSSLGYYKYMIKAVFGFTIVLLLIPAFYILADKSVTSQEPDLEQIIEKTKIRQYAVLDEVGCAICMAETVYRERKRNGELKKEVLTSRRIYTKGDDKRYDEYLSMSINGKKLSRKEMEKEIEDDKDDENEMKMPLTPEGEGGYDFYLSGSTEFNGEDVWIVGFRAKKEEDGYVNGKAYITKNSYDIIHAEASLAKIPRLVKDLKISVTSMPVGDYWMPEKFEVDLKIKLSFIYYKRITIEEKYYGYELNCDTDDSIFEKE